MKKTYEKPSLVKAGALPRVTAQDVLVRPSYNYETEG